MKPTFTGLSTYVEGESKSLKLDLAVFTLQLVVTAGTDIPPYSWLPSIIQCGEKEMTNDHISRTFRSLNVLV